MSYVTTRARPSELAERLKSFDTKSRSQRPTLADRYVGRIAGILLHNDFKNSLHALCVLKFVVLLFVIYIEYGRHCETCEIFLALFL